jgi:hypothetical protein
MSHVVAIDLEVHDLAALEAAAAEVGLLMLEKPTWEWYGQYQADYNGPDAAYRHGIDPLEYGRCDRALVLADSPVGRAALAARAAGEVLSPEGCAAATAAAKAARQAVPYEIGVRRHEAGGYRLAWDNWLGGFGLEDKVGPGAVRLRQAYALQAARLVAASVARHRVKRQVTLPDGTIRLTVSVPRS